MDTVSFKCVCSNARRLWTSQLEQAIDLYAITASEQEQARKPSLQSKTIGRLLVEVLNISNISPRIVESPPKPSLQSKTIGRLLVEVLNISNIPPRIVESPPQVLRLSVGRVSEVFEVDLSKSSDLHLTTQFPLETTTAAFSLTILQKNLYRPDALLLDETIVTLNELLRESAMHRGPIIKAMHLRKDIRDRTRPVETVAVKFVAQLFDANM
ncbi:hypothetical protein GCK32_008474 [Trichostrongylus colubriformis]|uniref:Uncharacterized protein n=1 Tax=Trichostrongylus colubriformis TaxID=6319 RepID=A0AAN8J252_TRICO